MFAYYYSHYVNRSIIYRLMIVEGELLFIFVVIFEFVTVVISIEKHHIGILSTRSVIDIPRS